MSGSWLFPDGIGRQRIVEMDRRIRPVRRSAFAVLAVALLASGPWLGYWTILPLIGAAALFRLAERRIESADRPEWTLFFAWVGSQAIIAISVALTGGPDVAAMSWFALPVVTLGARYSERGIELGVAVTLVFMCAVAFGVDTQAVLDEPPKLLLPAALVIATAMLVTVLMRSDLDARAQAVIDPLTGLLNRKALQTRTVELEQQSRLTGAPVALVVADVDRFKSVNDRFGHAAGDVILREVAYRLRKELRTFDALYRLGGEEFLVVLAGADVATAEALAERLRAALAADPMPEGLHVTASFGVAATTEGETFDYDAVFAAADAALYRAKAEGRDAVRVAGAPVAA